LAELSYPVIVSKVLGDATRAARQKRPFQKQLEASENFINRGLSVMKYLGI